MKKYLLATVGLSSLASFAAEGDAVTITNGSFDLSGFLEGITETLTGYVGQALPVIGTILGVAAGVMVLFMAFKLIKRALNKA